MLVPCSWFATIHGGKNKNDRVDSEKLTHLLRSNLIPPAYVYPSEKRPLRALLRQRIYYDLQKTGEGDKTGYCPLVSFVPKIQVSTRPKAPAGRSSARDIASERSIRPNGKSTKNWNRTPLGHER